LLLFLKSFFLVAVGLVLFTLGVRFGFALLATIILALKVSAFSLLGPFEEWQTPALGYNPLGNEVGAPKNLGEEYRWNVPVITYGFDESFMDYFGVLGVAAVDDAFFYLNALPTASAAELGNFSIDSRRFNFRAQAENIVDLKSVALGLMIEQLGLANPERYVWCLRDREAFSQPAITNYYVVNRNFDPESLLPSPFINETRYSYSVFEWATPQFADAGEYAVDPEHSYASAAGQFTQLYGGPEPGLFLNGITRDDFGGLKYLLSSNNINVEILPVGTGAKDGSTNFVNFALRPGVEKLKFEKI